MAAKKPDCDKLTFIVKNLQNISTGLATDRIDCKYAATRLTIEIRDLIFELGLFTKEELSNPETFKPGALDEALKELTKGE